MTQRKSVKSEFVMQYEIFGREVSLDGSAYCREANPRAVEIGRWWYRLMDKLLEQRVIRPHPTRKIGESWDSILGGVEQLRQGAVSGEKLVVLLPISN